MKLLLFFLPLNFNCKHFGLLLANAFFLLNELLQSVIFRLNRMDSEDFLLILLNP